jgi:excinuclease ABC subunit C
MNKQYLAHKKLPDAPGVYLFKKAGNILYIGKATSLKERTKSYFSNDLIETRGPKVVQMIQDATKLEWIETDSVLEALLLESHLIKMYKPPGNTLEKDNTSYNFVIITEEEFPRVLIVRGRQLATQWHESQIRETFGPFPHGSDIKIALKLIRKIFPYRDTCIPRVGKPCFNAQIGLCPNVCGGNMRAEEYGKTIEHISQFLKGEKKDVVQSLENEIKIAAKAERFEDAAHAQRQVFALNHIQDVALIKNDSIRVSTGGAITNRIEAYDVAHLSGQASYGVMVVMEDGRLCKEEYRLFTIEKIGNNDIESLKHILKRRLRHHEWKPARIIVLDGGQAQLAAAVEIVRAAGSNAKIVAVTKDEHHKARAVIGDLLTEEEKTHVLALNAEAHRFAITRHRTKLRKNFLG